MKNITFIVVCSLILFLKPISYQEVAHNKYVRAQSNAVTKISQIRGGKSPRAGEAPATKESLATDFTSPLGSVKKPVTSGRPDTCERTVIDQEHSPTSRLKKRKFNKLLHGALERYFPDSPDRVQYQKTQREILEAGLKKQQEAKRVGMVQSFKFSKKELDAIQYFSGNSIYKKFQDPQAEPNIFDTRQSFLRKMHDSEKRRNFLNTYKNTIK